jgi:hypothetical protein
LLGKIVFATPFPMDAPRCTVETAAKGIGIAKRHWNGFHGELVELFHLVVLAGFHANRLEVQDETIHG